MKHNLNYLRFCIFHIWADYNFQTNFECFGPLKQPKISDSLKLMLCYQSFKTKNKPCVFDCFSQNTEDKIGFNIAITSITHKDAFLPIKNA